MTDNMIKNRRRKAWMLQSQTAAEVALWKKHRNAL